MTTKRGDSHSYVHRTIQHRKPQENDSYRNIGPRSPGQSCVTIVDVKIYIIFHIFSGKPENARRMFNKILLMVGAFHHDQMPRPEPERLEGEYPNA